jgi:hypothetical protein
MPDMRDGLQGACAEPAGPVDRKTVVAVVFRFGSCPSWHEGAVLSYIFESAHGNHGASRSKFAADVYQPVDPFAVKEGGDQPATGHQDPGNLGEHDRQRGQHLHRHGAHDDVHAGVRQRQRRGRGAHHRHGAPVPGRPELGGRQVHAKVARGRAAAATAECCRSPGPAPGPAAARPPPASRTGRPTRSEPGSTPAR